MNICKTLKNYSQAVIVFLLFLSVSYILVGKNLQSKWWITDDHEIVLNVGPDSRLSLNEFIDAVSHSEIMTPGVGTRYRPSYYFLRFIEMFLWGKNFFLWHLTRFLFLLLFQFGVWLVLKRFFGTYIGLLSVAYIMTYRFWPELTLWLGPAEIYCMAFLPYYLYSLIKIWNLESTTKNWLILFFSYVICVGAKENFLFMILPHTLLLIRLLLAKKWNIFGLFLWTLSTSYSIFIIWAVFISTQASGEDIYTQSTNIRDRLNLFFVSVESIFNNPIILLFPIVTVLLMGIINIKSKQITKVLQKSLIFLLWYFNLILIWVSQHLFYGAMWPKSNRYDFPGILIPPAIYLVWIWYWICLFKILKKPIMIIGIKIITLLVLAYFTSKSGYSYLISSTNSNNLKTTEFTNKIESLTSELTNNSATPIVFYSHSLIDYEPLVSVARFLKSYGINNQIFIIAPVCKNDNTVDRWYQHLSGVICNWAFKGSDGFSFRPINELTKNKYYCVQFSGSTEDSNCIDSVVITTPETKYTF